MSLLLALQGGWTPEQSLRADESRVITPEQFASGVIPITDPRLISHLIENPRGLYGLSAWAFQELVAELLRNQGYPDVILGGRGRDGGVDIFAERRGDLGHELVIVQCKRFAEDHKVGEPVVKQFAYEVEEREATRGLIATTSTFTSDALKLIEEKRYRLTGKDFEKLAAWLGQVRDTTGKRDA